MQTRVSTIRSYDYMQLKPNEFRLFYMDVPENNTLDITGTMRNVSSAAEMFPVYTALSYAWGPTYEDDSHLKQSICCDTARLKVTSNLKMALFNIRSGMSTSALESWSAVSKTLECNQDTSHQLPLWIDAICIDQKNLQERSQQVRIMAKIYRRASHLLVWLGEIVPYPVEPDEFNSLFRERDPQSVSDGNSEDRLSETPRVTVWRLHGKRDDRVQSSPLPGERTGQEVINSPSRRY